MIRVASLHYCDTSFSLNSVIFFEKVLAIRDSDLPWLSN